MPNANKAVSVALLCGVLSLGCNDPTAAPGCELREVVLGQCLTGLIQYRTAHVRLDQHPVLGHEQGPLVDGTRVVRQKDVRCVLRMNAIHVHGPTRVEEEDHVFSGTHKTQQQKKKTAHEYDIHAVRMLPLYLPLLLFFFFFCWSYLSSCPFPQRFLGYTHAFALLS